MSTLGSYGPPNNLYKSGELEFLHNGAQTAYIIAYINDSVRSYQPKALICTYWCKNMSLPHIEIWEIQRLVSQCKQKPNKVSSCVHMFLAQIADVLGFHKAELLLIYCENGVSRMTVTYFEPSVLCQYFTYKHAICVENIDIHCIVQPRFDKLIKTHFTSLLCHYSNVPENTFFKM